IDGGAGGTVEGWAWAERLSAVAADPELEAVWVAGAFADAGCAAEATGTDSEGRGLLVAGGDLDGAGGGGAAGARGGGRGRGAGSWATAPGAWRPMRPCRPSPLR